MVYPMKFRFGWVCVTVGCLLVLALASSPLAAASTSHIPRVLVLHSYAPPMNWVQTITREIETVLDVDSGAVDLRLEYMDTKRYYDAEYLRAIYQMLDRKYRDTEIDLILCSDNNAYDFLRQHRDPLFPGTPVIFCGVNGFQPSEIEGLDQFTGVAEVYAPRETIELMLRLHPDTQEILVVNDFLTTGSEVRASIERDLTDLGERVRLDYNDNVPLDQLKQRLSRLGPGQLCLLGVYFGDSEGTYSTFEQMGDELADACPVPIYCLLDFNVTGGPIGGRVTGAQVQGRLGAEMAAAFLGGTPIDDLPPYPSGAFEWRFHHAALERYGIDVAALPAGSIVLGKPVSFLAGHRNLVIGTAAVMVVLLAVILVLSVNIRRRHFAEERLRIGREDLATTLQSIGDGVLATDHRGNVTRLNPVAQELLGWSLEEARGRHLSEVFRLRPSETAPPGTETDLGFETVLKSGEPVTIAPGTILVKRDGQECLIADSGAPILSSDGSTRGVVIVFRDVTQQLDLERRLRQAEKMESVGQLAGGIAHDFNNMLAGIMGYAELLQMELQEDPEALESCVAILRASERAADLTRKLLDFSRQGKLLSTPLDLHDVIQDALSLLKRTVGQSVTLESDLVASQSTLVGDPTQLQQMIMNLCINARDAMPDGGVIRIRTEVVHFDDEQCARSAFDLQPGSYVRLSVRDNGTGIPDSVRGRIFEPFFTTKERGRGTGLGLAAVYGCVEVHEGAIEVETGPGSGTTFNIDLPLHDIELPRSIIHDEMVPTLVQGTVLVVDDDDTVRGMAVEMLQGMGYEVYTASDGIEGLEIYREHRDQIDVVLLDLVMPRLGGRSAFASIRSADPEACVILSSGFADPEAVNHLLEQGLCAFIAKPYSRVDLAETIRAALRKRRSALGGQS